MRIYLAARYSRREELYEYRYQINGLVSHTVEAVWLDGQHQISDSGKPIGELGESLVEGDDGSTSTKAREMRSKFATDDMCDVMAADLLIAFTEPPRSGHSRGGRHVELGIALGAGKLVWIVGHRENIFCWLDDVVFFETFAEALAELKKMPANYPKGD